MISRCSLWGKLFILISFSPIFSGGENLGWHSILGWTLSLTNYFLLIYTPTPISAIITLHIEYSCHMNIPPRKTPFFKLLSNTSFTPSLSFIPDCWLSSYPLHAPSSGTPFISLAALDVPCLILWLGWFSSLCFLFCSFLWFSQFSPDCLLFLPCFIIPSFASGVEFVVFS